MSRLTITLSEARCRALKEASARRDKTIGQLIVIPPQAFVAGR